MSKRIVIIGAGPCGLGAAKRLFQLGHDDWILFERESYAGGLSSSFTDDRGFTWDMGGHVIFSHYQEFDSMLEETCGGDLLYHQRKSYVKVNNSRVPYPFQNNLRYLSEDEAFEALSGLKSAPGGNPSMPFDEWIVSTFGPGIDRLFMRPYNNKVWATDPAQMASRWIAERVSVVTFEEALKAYLSGRKDFDWGPNSTFSFPLRGGTGEVFRRLAASLPQNNMNYSRDVVRWNARRKTLTLDDGSHVEYDYLISTIPLDQLIEKAEGMPEIIRKWAERLRHSGTYVVGCGLKVPLIGDWSWMYFPEPEFPFNRVTNFARYSPFNVPNGRTDQYSAYMCEISFSDTKPENHLQVTRGTWKGLFDAGLIMEHAEKASEYLIKVPYAYPVPTLDRDEALRILQPYLMKRGVYSRGRFGSWLYEVGNMDHSYKQGMDAVDYILSRKEEDVWKLK